MKRQLSSNGLIYILSFIFPVLIFSIILILFQVYPFGSDIALITDLYHQYIHFYSYAMEAIKGNGSLLYSWNAGLGSNFIGNVAYYTASPLLFLLFFFPKELFSEGVLVLILVKIGLCGTSISYLIRRKFPSFKMYEIVFFSSFYALMSYNITYYYNVMWLDGVILLPLIILAVDRILHNKSVIPYVVVLSLLFLVNFYISFMIGLFVFLYLVLELFKQKKLNLSIDLKTILLKFMKGTLLAIGISAILTIPTFFQLLGALGSETLKDLSTEINRNYFLKVFSGVYDSVENGSPTIYIGSFVLLLVPTFFMSTINSIEKIKWGALLFILGISFIVPPLNLLWHAGDIPNWFPYRYAFLFSFVLLMISLKGYENISTIRTRSLVLIYTVSLILIALTSITKMEELNSMIQAIMITLFGLLLLLKKFHVRKVTFSILFLFTITELLFNTGTIYFKVNEELGRLNRERYTIYQDYREVIDQVKNRDVTKYYRLETDVDNSNNDSLTLNHSSFGYSSSMISNHFIHTMGALGFFARKANYNHKGHTILTESMFGLKYFVSSQKREMEGYHLDFRTDNYYIYKNKNFLPVGYPVAEDVQKIQVRNSSNPFELQNEIYKTLYSADRKLFTPITPGEVNYQNGTMKHLESGKQLIRKDRDKPIIVSYNFDIHKPTHLYSLFDFDEKDHIKVWINNKEIKNGYKSSLLGLIDTGLLTDESVTLELRIDKEQAEWVSNELFYVLDTQYFSTYVENINRSAFTVTELKENKMEAHVQIEQQDQLLFLSLPWDEGWRITVDGKRVQPKKVLGAFMGIPLEKGEHDLHLTFIPKGFILGGIISLASFIILLIIVRIEFIKGRERGSFTYDNTLNS